MNAVWSLRRLLARWKARRAPKVLITPGGRRCEMAGQAPIPPEALTRGLTELDRHLDRRGLPRLDRRRH